MKKYLKTLSKVKEQEKEINYIIPKISFISSILRKESFVEDIKIQLLSYSEMSSKNNILFKCLFFFITSPIWLISETFVLRYNFKYFQNKYLNKYIYTEENIAEQKRIINENKKNIKKYKEIIGKNNLFSNIENKKNKITKEDFDTMTIRSECVFYIESQLEELYKSFQKNPTDFTEYFNHYANTKKDIEEDINFIAKSLNSYIVKNTKPDEDVKEKLHRAKILKFNKKD